MLNNHAPVVADLSKGFIKIEVLNKDSNEEYNPQLQKSDSGNLLLEISSGTLEMKDNKAIVLAD